VNVVIDTNVLISGLINPDGTPAKIINLLINERITIFYDNRILQEYIGVLHREKFGFTTKLIDPLLDFIKNEGQFVTADPITTHFSDEKDKMFLEVTKSAAVDYLITGNTKHFPENNRIVTPKEFIDILG
jgi:uncharacterized protein